MGFEGSVAHPLTFPDLLAWSTLTRTLPRGWEVKALMAMDRVRVALLNDVEVDLFEDEESELTVDVFDQLFPL